MVVVVCRIHLWNKEEVWNPQDFLLSGCQLLFEDCTHSLRHQPHSAWYAFLHSSEPLFWEDHEGSCDLHLGHNLPLHSHAHSDIQCGVGIGFSCHLGKASQVLNPHLTRILLRTFWSLFPTSTALFLCVGSWKEPRVNGIVEYSFCINFRSPSAQQNRNCVLASSLSGYFPDGLFVLRVLNCCCCGRLGQDRDTLAQTVWFFADFFKPIDFSPVDIVVAMILAAHRQRFQRGTAALSAKDNRRSRKAWSTPYRCSLNLNMCLLHPRVN